MRNATMIVLLAFVAQAHAQEVAANHASDTQASVDKLVDKLVAKLFDRALKAASLNRAELYSTTLEKPRHVAIPPCMNPSCNHIRTISHIPTGFTPRITPVVARSLQAVPPGSMAQPSAEKGQVAVV